MYFEQVQQYNDHIISDAVATDITCIVETSVNNNYITCIYIPKIDIKLG